MNTDLIAMNQDKLGLGAPVVQHQGEVYVVAKDMERIMGPKRAVVIMNLTDEPRSIDVSVEALGFRGPVSLYDCFDHVDIKDFSPETSFKVTLRPHASAAYFVTGKRLEKSVYQAEEAYLNKFTTIEGIPSPVYLGSISADMGMFVMGLGNSVDNWLEWSNVYSRNGGTYIASIRYASMAPAGFTLSVNGKKVETVDGLDTGSASGVWDTVNVKIKLKRGLNKVRLSCDGLMPSIDCMELHRGNE